MSGATRARSSTHLRFESQFKVTTRTVFLLLWLEELMPHIDRANDLDSSTHPIQKTVQTTPRVSARFRSFNRQVHPTVIKAGNNQTQAGINVSAVSESGRQTHAVKAPMIRTIAIARIAIRTPLRWSRGERTELRSISYSILTPMIRWTSFTTSYDGWRHGYEVNLSETENFSCLPSR